MLDTLFNYVGSGARLSAGFWPVTSAEMGSMGISAGPPGAGMRYESFGPHVFKSNMAGGASNRFKIPEHVGNAPISKGAMGKIGAFALPGVGLAMSAYFVGSGYSEGGMQGAVQAAYTDVAIMAATSSALFRTTQAGVVESKAIGGLISGPLGMIGSARTARFAEEGVLDKQGNPRRSRFSGAASGLKSTRVMLGAGIGAMLGSEVGGMPGTFLGAYTMGHMARMPHLTGAALLTGGAAYMAGRAGLSYLKAGYKKERNRTRIDSAGSTASFMTQNAFTSRQRAVSAMQNSHLNARSAMGMEATYMHMNRDYFSQYRRM